MDERFKTLVRHFFSRFFDKDSISPNADAHANVVQIVAMLALPGAIVSLFTIADHPLIRSIEPGETWKYCFPDAVVAR